MSKIIIITTCVECPFSRNIKCIYTTEKMDIGVYLTNHSLSENCPLLTEVAEISAKLLEEELDPCEKCTKKEDCDNCPIYSNEFE